MRLLQSTKRIIRKILSSCDEKPEQKPLVIGPPTDFRRETSYPGLTAEQNDMISKYKQHAQECLEPIHSNMVSEPPSEDGDDIHPHPLDSSSGLRRISKNIKRLSGGILNFGPMFTSSGVEEAHGSSVALAQQRAVSGGRVVRRSLEGNSPKTSSDSVTLHNGLLGG